MRSLLTKTSFLLGVLAFAGLANAQDYATLSNEQLRVLQRGLSNSQIHFRPIDDVVLQGFMDKFQDRLGASDRIYMTFSDSRTVNAVAMLGNVIMFHAGMVLFTTNQNQLAGVLAHELAHVTQEHFSRLPNEIEPHSKLALGSFLVALLASPEIADEVLLSTQSISSSLAYETIRRFEREADQRAVRTLLATSFDPADYIKLIERMGKVSSSGLPEYLSTHPITDNRISDLQAYIRNVRNRVPSNSVDHEQLSYWLIRARIRHLINENYRNTQISSEYAPIVEAYAKLLDRLPGSEDASELAANATNWIIAAELGEAYSSFGEHAKAERILLDALTYDSDNPVLRGTLLIVYAKAKERVKAVKMLASMKESMRMEPPIVEAEIQLWFELDEKLRYDVAVAFGQYVRGNLESARNLVDNLRGKQAGDSTQKSAYARLELLEKKIKLLQGSS